MELVDSGYLSRAVPGTRRAALMFPCIVVLANGALLATLCAGSSKDSDDQLIELYRSDDGGTSWQFQRQLDFDGAINGARGTLKLCYLTELAPGRLVAAAMWVDRTSYPGQPLFNPQTEGCLPMSILLAESTDDGVNWIPWRLVPVPPTIGPASLTSPLLQLADGTWALSIESNKHYEDADRWFQRVILLCSHDNGATWEAPLDAGYDPTGRIFNWDQRMALAPDGRIAAFTWTYDSQTQRYLHIHRRISADGGLSWSAHADLGFADQAGHPAVLGDGRVVLPWVDRFGTRTIRARLAQGIDAEFSAASDIELYALGRDAATAAGNASTADLLVEMSLWTFGLPYAEALPDGDVLVTYYAGTPDALDIRWSRLRV